MDHEINRVRNDIEKTNQEIARGRRMLDNPGFTGRAPAEVVGKERRQLDENLDKLAILTARLDRLNSARE